MKLKYTGIAPITNIYGEWSHGEIKEVNAKEIPVGFVEIVAQESKPTKLTKPNIAKKYKKIFKPKIDDKMERESVVIEHGD